MVGVIVGVEHDTARSVVKLELQGSGGQAELLRKSIGVRLVSLQ